MHITEWPRIWIAIGGTFDLEFERSETRYTRTRWMEPSINCRDDRSGNRHIKAEVIRHLHIAAAIEETIAEAGVQCFRAEAAAERRFQEHFVALMSRR